MFKAVKVRKPDSSQARSREAYIVTLVTKANIHILATEFKL